MQKRFLTSNKVVFPAVTLCYRATVFVKKFPKTFFASTGKETALFLLNQVGIEIERMEIMKMENKKAKALLSSALLVGTLAPGLIAKAWRNPQFFASLSEEVRSQIPENPAGQIQTKWHIDLKKGLEVADTAAVDCTGTGSQACDDSATISECGSEANVCERA